MKKFKHLSIALMAAAMGLSSCSLLDLITGKGVVSIEVTAKIKNVYECSSPFKVEANVEVKKDTDKSVTWSSSNEKVAKVSDKGIVTPLKVGKVEITATSTHDTSKSGSIKIDVLPAGEHKQLIAEGFDYSAKFPEKEVNKFAGVNMPSFEAPEGFYYKEEYSEKYKYYFYSVYFEYTEDNYNSFEEAVDATDLFYFEQNYILYSFDCYLDPTQVVEMDFATYDISDEDAEDYEYVFALTYYHTEDIWYSSVDTTDTAWPEDLIDELAFFNATDLPFVALGEEYEFEYDSDYEELVIADYCCDYTKLESYGQELDNASYESHMNEYGVVYYTKVIDEYTYACVVFGFDGMYGNTITLSYLPREINYYPKTKVDTFVSETIGSVWSVLEYTQTEGGVYTYEEHANDGYWARVSIKGCTEAECEAYVYSLVTYGYEVASSSEKKYGYTVATLVKDKIVVQAVIEFDSHESSNEEITEMLSYYGTYSQLTPAQVEALSDEQHAHYELVMDQYDEYCENAYYFDEYYFTVYDYTKVEAAYLTIWENEDTVGKEAGLYVENESANLTVGGEPYQITYYFFEMEAQAVTFTSSDESVLTVTSEGVVTAVAAGEATVTVKSSDESVEAVVTITVSAAE